MFSTMLVTASAISALAIGVLGQTGTITAGTPVSAAATSTGTLVSLVSNPVHNHHRLSVAPIMTRFSKFTLIITFPLSSSRFPSQNKPSFHTKSPNKLPS